MSKAQRVFSVLEYLAAGHPPATQAELMRALGIQRSTLSDLLGELQDLGYLELRERRYLPGVRLVALVHRAAQQPGFGASLQPTLATLAETTGETAVFVVERHRAGMPAEVVSIDQVESGQPIRYVATIGRPYPMHTSVTGKVFLAFGAHDAAPAHLRAELDEARRKGYLIGHDAAEVTSLAAPVFDRFGALIGVLSIVGPSGRIRAAESTIWALVESALARLASGQSV